MIHRDMKEFSFKKVISAPEKNKFSRLNTLEVHGGKLSFCDYDSALEFYPKKARSKDVQLIVNLCRRFGEKIIILSKENPKAVMIPFTEDASILDFERARRDIFSEVTAALKKGGHVLFHCEQALVRSPSLVVYYLVKEADFDQSDAVSLVVAFNKKISFISSLFK